MSDHASGASPPLERHSPIAAGLFGLCLGPLGTAWTLATERDLAVTGTATLIATFLIGGHKGFALCMLFCGIYGAVRVTRDNARVDAAERVAAQTPAEVSAEAVDWPPSPLAFEAVALALVEMLAEAAPERAPNPPLVIDDLTPAASIEPALLTAPVPEPVALPAEAPTVEVDPLPPPPPAPRKRGRPKGSRKLAA